MLRRSRARDVRLGRIHRHRHAALVEARYVREALAKCELALPRLSVHLERRALGDGHANRRKSSRGDISDDVFKYALVWIEQERREDGSSTARRRPTSTNN